MTDDRKIIEIMSSSSELNEYPLNSIDVIVISSNFYPDEKYLLNPDDFKNEILIGRLETTYSMIEKAFTLLKNGGLIFVYGVPRWTAQYGSYLNKLKNPDSKMLFKYWIAIDLDDRKNKETFPYSHTVLLMYLKTRKTNSPSPFHLNTKEMRIPYKICKSCDRNVKDWGGKVHLINPLGAAVSDVWKDFPRQFLQDNVIPDSIINRVYDLTKKEKFKFVHIIEKQEKLQLDIDKHIDNGTKDLQGYKTEQKTFLQENETNSIIKIDSLRYMKHLYERYPQGIFDLAFADPPYNLEKEYDAYDDNLKDQRYLDWCNKWLSLMSRVIRPGGALLVVNLPKWVIEHVSHLNSVLEFRHWIVWDSLSSPAGKIMPAHYAMAYFTKPEGNITFNYHRSIQQIDADHYCIRASCIRKRKSINDDDKVILNEFWWDIHRIKHKKYRDYHPCQLPVKLMERVIKVFTNPGDIVYDPFCGTGTTAISAKMHNRKYISTDLDEKYVEIAKKSLKSLLPTLDGGFKLPKSKKAQKRVTSLNKKKVEMTYIELCKKNGRIIEISELEVMNKNLATTIMEKYGDFKRLKKLARRRMELHETVKSTQK